MGTKKKNLFVFSYSNHFRAAFLFYGFLLLQANLLANDNFENFIKLLKQCDLNGDNQFNYYPKESNRELNKLKDILSNSSPFISEYQTIRILLSPLDEMDQKINYKINFNMLGVLKIRIIGKTIYLEKLKAISTWSTFGNIYEKNIKRELTSFIFYLKE